MVRLRVRRGCRLTEFALPLPDDTGNRRFWCVEVGATEFDLLQGDRDQLWAEAAAREAAGEPLNIPADLWPDAAATADKHQVIDPIADKLDDVLGHLPAEDVIVRSEDLYTALDLTDVARRGGRPAQVIAIFCSQ